MIAEAELGDQILRALILRRASLIETGAGGPVLIGPAYDGNVIRLQAFLARNGYPHQLLDPTEDREAATLIEQYGAKPDHLPLAVCPKGTVLKIRLKPSSPITSGWCGSTSRIVPST